MSGNTSQQTDATSSKYSTSMSSSDEGVTSLSEGQQHDEQPVIETAPDESEESEEPSPEDNATATYEFGTLPTTFELAMNPAAWHPSWGPVPQGFENVVARTQTLSADTQRQVGETDDGQPVKQGVRAIKKGNYTNTPDGMGATVGSGWTYDTPDWQLMERELAGHGVELSGSGVARLEAATAEQAAEDERRAQLPSQQDVHEHYEPAASIDEDSNVMTLWDEADDDTLTEVEGILGETGETQQEAMSMVEAHEEVREYTMACAERRARESREAVAEAGITNTTQPNFDFFTNAGNRTLISRQAGQRAPDHRPFHRDFMRARPLGGHYPKWGGWEPETTEMEVGGGETVEVATDPIAPIPDDEVEWAFEQAQQFLLSRSMLDTMESSVMRLFDRNAECAGLSSAETFYADYSEELEAGEPHPASEESAAFVAPDGSIPDTAAATALGVPSVARTREAYEGALAHERDPIRAFEPAMETLWHGDATQSLKQIDADWPGCSVLARVTKSYIPNDPESQQQVLYLEDVTPNVAEPGQVGPEVKLTVWRKSQIETYASVGDVVSISNPKPGEFRGELTLAATGDTSIDRLVESDEALRSHIDARSMSGMNDGAQRLDGSVAPSVGGTIADDEDVTRLPNKRYRPPEATFQRGPPEQDKNTRLRRPMAERPVPMTTILPIMPWMRERNAVPETGDTAGRDTRGEAVSRTDEPDQILEDNSVQVSPDVFAITLQRLTSEVGDWGALVGARQFDPRDVGAEVDVYADPDALGGIDEVVGVIEHHPHAPDELEVRVFSGITLDPEAENTAMRVVEWDTEADEPVDFDTPVTHTLAWETRVLKKVRTLRNKQFDASKPHPEALVGDSFTAGQTEDGVDVVDLDAARAQQDSPSDHPEWQSRMIIANDDGSFECPVEGCEFSHPTKKQSVVSHMGGMANDCADHAAMMEAAAPDDSGFVVGETEDGVDVVDISAV